MPAPVLTASHLTKTFGSGPAEVHAVQDVSLDVRPGQLVLIMGPSGSGKTTLLSMLGGLLKPTSGQITVSGVDITAMSETHLPAVRASNIGFIFICLTIARHLAFAIFVYLTSASPGPVQFSTFTFTLPLAQSSTHLT